MKKLILVLTGCLVGLACEAQIRVLPMGDSVTSSFAPYSSYRYWLWHTLVDHGFDVDFVGTQYGVNGGTPDKTDYDQNHEGHNGWHTYDGAANAASIARATNPDIVLLDLGANDVESGEDPAGSKEGLRQIIQAFRDVNPNVVVLLALPTPTSSNYRGLLVLDRNIRRLAVEENHRESPVRVVNLTGGFNRRLCTFDGEHPNERGEKIIARRWYIGMLRYLRR